MQEKIAILREHESLQKEIDRLKSEKQASIKYKDLADGQVMALTKSLETLQNSIKEKEILVILNHFISMSKHCTMNSGMKL